MPGFTIPNTPDAANQNQAEPDSLDFQIIGNQRNGIVNGMAVTPGSAVTVAVASGEVLINGIHYTFGGNSSLTLTTYASTNFFDIVYARVSGGTITCYVAPGVGGIGNPRYPATGQINFDTDVVLAAIWRTGATTPTTGEITDKRVFVRSNASRINADTVSSNRGSTGDTFVNGAWSPSSNLVSPLSVKVGSTWYNLARYSENFSAGVITANLVGNVTGNVTGTAGSVAWSGITGLPALVYNNGGNYNINISGTAGGVPWSGITGIPAIAYNNGGTYSINVTGSAGSAGSASTAGYLSAIVNVDPLGAPYIGWSSSLGQWSVAGQMFLGATLYMGVTGSSSSTRALVRNDDGRIAHNTNLSLRDHKENISDMEDGLEVVNKLRPRTFIFKESKTDMSDPYEVFARREQLQYGFVVEEVIEVNPDFIHHEQTKNGIQPQMWKHHALIAVLTKAVQELSAKVEALEAQ